MHSTAQHTRRPANGCNKHAKNAEHAIMNSGTGLIGANSDQGRPITELERDLSCCRDVGSRRDYEEDRLHQHSVSAMAQWSKQRTQEQSRWIGRPAEEDAVKRLSSAPSRRASIVRDPRARTRDRAAASQPAVDTIALLRRAPRLWNNCLLAPAKKSRLTRD